MTRPGFVALIAVALVSLAAGQEKKSPAKNDALQPTKEEQELIDLTNAERKKAELPPLKANDKLMAAARAHAENMAKQDVLKHKLDDKEPTDRAKDVGYKYSRLAENIEKNGRTPAEAMKDWMGSPPHKENILGKDYQEIGVAMAKNKKGERYWVQVFGKQLGK
jgi:uncharacterized protein YkwD